MHRSSIWKLLLVSPIAAGALWLDSGNPALAQYTDATGLPVNTGGFAGPINPDRPLNQVTITTPSTVPNDIQQTVQTITSVLDGVGLDNVSSEIRSVLAQLSGWFNLGAIFGSDGAIAQVLQGNLSALAIPDTSKTAATIFQDGNLGESSTLANRLEIKTQQPSFSVKADLNHSSDRDAARGIAYSSAISEAAQTQGAQRLQSVNTAATVNTQLGQESQTLDVTQQIMQNLSGQMAQDAQIQASLYGEAYQARIDRANGLILQTQMAELLNGKNASERRAEIAANRGAGRGAAFLNLPGGKVLDGSSAPSRSGVIRAAQEAVAPANLQRALGE
jgi:hypothetical protein